MSAPISNATQAAAESNFQTSAANMLDNYQKVQDAEQQKRAILRELLEEQLRSEGHVLVTEAKMGGTTSYVGTGSLRWIAERIKLASQMPLLRNKLNPETGDLIIDQDTIEELRQRAPDWSRDAALAHYLIKSQSRKFPPILVVVSELWVDDPRSENWNPDGTARKTSMPFEPLDRNGKVGTIDFRSDIAAYVADGQHRVIAIMSVLELLRTGQLPLMDKVGKQTGFETREDLVKRYNINDAQLQQLEHESLGIEFIPAVMKGETREKARRRVRAIFVHVNKTAKRLTEGELALLDEDNGCAIVGRRLALHHSLLKRDQPGDRVNFKSNALPAGGKWLTTLTTLKDMAKAYLTQRKPFSDWLPQRRDEIPLRPEEQELDQGQQLLDELWDYIAKLPSFSDIQRGGKIDEWREFKSKRFTNGKGHLLMRPLGQLVFAEAIGWLHLHEDGPQLSLDAIFEKLKRFDEDGGFEVQEPRSPWYGITYEPARQRMSMTDRDTAVKMLIHLVHGLSPDQREQLLHRFRELRTIPDASGQPTYLNHDGKPVKDQSKIQLPPMI